MKKIKEEIENKELEKGILRGVAIGLGTFFLYNQITKFVNGEE